MEFFERAGGRAELQVVKHADPRNWLQFQWQSTGATKSGRGFTWV